VTVLGPGAGHDWSLSGAGSTGDLTARLAAFLDAPTGLVLMDIENGLHDANHAFAAMLGRTREELACHGLRALTHPDDVDIAGGAIVDLLAAPGMQPVTFTKRYLHADGTAVWADGVMSVIRGADGRPLCLIASITDASERMRDEAARQARADRAVALAEVYKALAESDNSDPALLFRTITRTICEHVGDHCVLLLAQEGSAELRLVTMDSRDPDFAEAATAVLLDSPTGPDDPGPMGHTLRTLTPLLVNVEPLKLIGRIPDGYAQLSVRWNVHSVIWIPLHLGDRVVGLLSVCRFGDRPNFEDSDLELLVAISGQATLALENAALATEHRLAANALLDSEQRFRAAFDDAPIGMALTDLRGRMEWVNKSLCTMLGYSSDELLELGFQTFIPAEDFRGDVELTRRLATGELTHHEMDMRMFRKDGQPIWVHTTLGVIRDQHGRLTHLIGHAQDVTARRHAEAEVERQRHHAELTARLSEALAAVGLDRTAVLDKVAQTVSEELGDYCVLLIQDKAGDLRLAAAHHRDPAGAALVRRLDAENRLNMENNISGMAFTTGKSVIVPVVDAEQLRHRMLPDTYVAMQGFGGLSSLVCIPLRVQTSVVGVISVGRHGPGNPFTDADAALLEDIAGRCAVAIANAQLHTDVNAAHERLVIDVAARQAAEEGQRVSEERFRRVFDNSPLGIALMGDDFVYQRVNPSFARITGYGADFLVGRTYQDITHPDDIAAGERLGRRLLVGEHQALKLEKRYVRPDGTIVWVRLTVGVLQDTETEDRTYITTIEDITESTRAAQQLAHLALHDSLTGLPNRVLLRDRLSQRLADLARVPGHHLAVLYVDLDRFKDVNDSLGHDVGDDVLLEIATRLQATIRPVDTAARVGGDEFVVVCGGLTSPAEAVHLAERIEAAVSAPVTIGARVLHPSASVGVATTTADTESPDELIHRADTAMYRAKNRGRNRHELFDDELAASVSDRLHAAERVRTAMDEDRFHLHYQPIIELATGTIIGAEALLRMEDPQRGMLLPIDFLDAAEDSGLIVPLGEWVLREACRQLAEWQVSLHRPFEMAVNISGRQINQIDIRRLVIDAVDTTGVDPTGLTLEMTETVLLEAAGNAVENLEALKALGIRLAIDDFGTGYSSLVYLKRFPVDIVKIDRSFTMGLGVDRDDTAIVGAIVSLGENLGLTVVAEGVETELQAGLLRELRCDHAQGWLYSRAVPPEDLFRMLG
jgi:diguanylate cyclase (GGDEF)-like protein/PAS domain S-box-containing protein